MTQTVVPATVTPITEGAASTLLTGELTRALGKVPSREMATLLFALSWLENGRGRPIQNNMGNLSAGDSYPTVWRPEWYDLETVQALPQGEKRDKLLRLHAGMIAVPPTVPKAFRAYESAALGMRNYVDELMRSFPEVVRAAETGDANAFVTALHQKYSKDYGPAHVASFASFQKGFGERQLFAALPKADGTPGAEPSSLLSQSPVSWPSVLERVRDVPIIRLHSSSFYVVCWKRFLQMKLKMVGSALTPEFDASCEEATKSFQKAHELKEDGIVGPLTWAKMLEG